MKLLSSLLVRVLTHNIRFATTSPGTGEQPWAVRAPYLLSELRYHATLPASIICLQEVLHNQLTDVLSGLNGNSSVNATFPSGNNPSQAQLPLPFPNNDDNATSAPEWAHIGVGRDDGATAGEYSPILYRPAEWRLLTGTTYWLSPTPSTPSRGWDAVSPRVWTVAELQHHSTGVHFLVVNTHMDDQGAVSRREGAAVIAHFLRNYRNAHPETPFVLAGDFNSDPRDEAYRYLAAMPELLRDAFDVVPPPRRYGDYYTFTGFKGKENDLKRIDFAWVGLGGGNGSDVGRVENYAVLPNRFENHVYSSDHRAVVADLVL
ncbi:uncharacterized protein K452DRAFT_282366 [Aplosporella prunicola CBS 121167]|uniref:Endonuclease/exonuclease/phosphatase domain-containing protein n=1 Tax=Aplosporella prunicola CBS 121167 TaxID=1176127 RepID=A0A6A6BTP4_9PEZI|nr:uncharacterized protein K452DRAFT_282366 [Aplosporella prunicola CBS 121167]KAF2147360.1 hypothetical protein K452DRAFT_282366 [Aplosporella prunicola CBS 121167]